MVKYSLAILYAKNIEQDSCGRNRDILFDGAQKMRKQGEMLRKLSKTLFVNGQGVYCLYDKFFFFLKKRIERNNKLLHAVYWDLEVVV